MKKTLLGISLFALLLGLSGCQTTGTPAVRTPDPPPVRVKIVRLETQPFAATVSITGTLVCTSRVDVKAETTGRVVKVGKEEGNPVTAGEPVVWVDETNYRLAVSQADSAVKVAEAAVEKARVAEAHSRSEVERARKLEKSGGITDKDLKTAEVADQDARAQVSLAMAQLEQARVAAETARKRLRDTVIRAPVAGEIQKKYVTVGAYVEPPTAVFSVVDNRRLELESQVVSAELAPIRAGQKVAFTVNSFPGATFEGRVIEINPAMDAETRSAKVRIRVDNSGGKLRAGMFAQGEILTGVERNAIVVPAAAVYRDDRAAKEAFVFLAGKQRAARRPIRIGREKESLLEVVSGLQPGDLLIAEQSIEIAEGVRVEAR